MYNNAAIEHLLFEADAIYNWSYGVDNQVLRSLYEKGKRDQWNGSQDLDWSLSVDPENWETFPKTAVPIYGSDVWHKLNEKEQTNLSYEFTSWRISNFLHGEQGALLTTAQIVVVAPSMDAKFYGATQVMDEGRHVEVFERYLREKVLRSYPINKDLKTLLDTILSDKRWDMKYLGMQIIVEGLALATIGVLRGIYQEPLLEKLLKYVMLDEARHVAFGVISVADFYKQLTEKERQEREDFAYEACVLMSERLLGQEVWERTGLPVKDCLSQMKTSSITIGFRQLLFSRVIPNLKRLGLITDRVRSKYEKMGVLRFENDPNSEQELTK